MHKWGQTEGICYILTCELGRGKQNQIDNSTTKPHNKIIYILVHNHSTSWLCSWHKVETTPNISLRLCSRLHSNSLLKALAHYTKNCKKCSYLPYTHYNFFFSTATTFSTVFYMSNNFLTDFFRKILAVLCVVWKGLHTLRVCNSFIRLLCTTAS